MHRRMEMTEALAVLKGHHHARRLYFNMSANFLSDTEEHIMISLLKLLIFRVCFDLSVNVSKPTLKTRMYLSGR